MDARSDRPPRLLEHLSGPLVGVMPGLEYELFLDRLNDGETCLLFTDGVTEAMNENKELYGEERLMELMARHRNARPKERFPSSFRSFCATGAKSRNPTTLPCLPSAAPIRSRKRRRSPSKPMPPGPAALRTRTRQVIPDKDDSGNGFRATRAADA